MMPSYEVILSICSQYVSSNRCAKELGVDINTFRRWCKKYGIEAPSKYKMSEEAKAKRRVSNTGKGHNISQESREKLSKLRKGIKLSDEVCRAISEGHKKYYSIESNRKKQSEILLARGYKHSEETRKKISEGNYGRVLSEESCKKISDGVKQNYRDKMCQTVRHPEDFNRDFIIGHFVKDKILDMESFKGYFGIDDYYACYRIMHHFDIELEYKDNKQSQKQFVEYIRGIYDGEVVTDTRKVIGPSEIDVFLPELNIGIEFNGCYWHSLEMCGSSRKHQDKSKKCQDVGVELIHVWEDQWKHKTELVKTILKSRLGVLDVSKKIYARQCKIKEIDDKEYRKFVSVNHIQGYRRAEVMFGLFYHGELVQIASFSRTRGLGKNRDAIEAYEWEWIRGCPASNNVVIGGTSRLFKHFVRQYNPKSVLCYADWNLFNGRGYKECGFELDGYTEPDKFYVTASTCERINRNPYKYRQMKELVQKKELLECYGAGSMRFVWKEKELKGE